MISRYLHRGRHLYDTGVFKTLPLERQVRPGKYANQPKPVNPNVTANGSNTFVWPLASPSVDADPTRKVQALPKPRPYTPTPNVVVEPPMTPKDALTMEKACLYGAVLVAILGAVILIVVNVAAVS